jgi:hypothetical protein
MPWWSASTTVSHWLSCTIQQTAVHRRASLQIYTASSHNSPNYDMNSPPIKKKKVDFAVSWFGIFTWCFLHYPSIADVPSIWGVGV